MCSFQMICKKGEGAAAERRRPENQARNLPTIVIRLLMTVIMTNR